MNKRKSCFSSYLSYHKKKNDYNAETYKVYFEERKQLIETANKSAFVYAQHVLTLSAGSFGLSFVFIKQAIPEIRPDTFMFLKNAWICYGISIVSTLFAIFLSQQALLRQIEILEYTYYPDRAKVAKRNPCNWLVVIFSNAGLILFTIGTCYLTYFGLKNIYLLGGK